MTVTSLLQEFPLNRRLTRDEAVALIHGDLEQLLSAAASRRDAAHGQQGHVDIVQLAPKFHAAENTGIARVVHGEAIGHAHNIARRRA